MAATASFEGRVFVRNALPPWVTNRAWSPRMTFWKITITTPKINNGVPMAAAAPKLIGDCAVKKYIWVVNTVIPALRPSNSGPVN